MATMGAHRPKSLILMVRSLVWLPDSNPPTAIGGAAKMKAVAARMSDGINEPSRDVGQWNDVGEARHTMRPYACRQLTSVTAARSAPLQHS
jgi:hypothetical protein